MRGLVCGLLIGLSCATSGFATKPADREPFVMRVEQLAKYLDLTASFLALHLKSHKEC